MDRVTFGHIGNTDGTTFRVRVKPGRVSSKILKNGKSFFWE